MPRPLPVSSLPPEEPRTTHGFYHPAVGEVFEPHRVHQDNDARRSRGFAAIYLPAIMSCQRTISDRRVGDGPKRVYEYLIGRAGENGDCWPSYERIAKDLGKSRRQVQNDIQLLEELSLITHQNRAERKSNTYHFIWHLIFEGQWTAPQMRGKVRSISSFEWQNPADLSGSGLPTNIYKESSQKKAAAEHAVDSTDSIQVVRDMIVASSTDGFPGRNAGALPDSRAVEEVSAVLFGNGVAIRALTEVPALIAFARENRLEPAELARFIEHKCREKSASGNPIRSVKFFFRCIPGDLTGFRGALAKNQIEHSPPRFWVDPYENLTRRGGSHG